MGQMRVRRTGPWVKISCPFSWVQFSSRWGQRLGQKKQQVSYWTQKCGKSPDFVRNQDFSGCGSRTRTCDLRVMRQSQAQIGVISAPICAFCRRSLGGFSIVSVQHYPLFSRSGSKLGQDRFTGNFQSRNVIYQCIPHRGDVDCTISVDIEIPGVLNDTPRNCFVLCLSFVGKLRY